MTDAAPPNVPADPARATSRTPRTHRMLYGAVRALVAGFCRVYFRTTYEGRERVPAQGAFLLSPIHRSYVDSFVAAGVTRRRMRFLGKAEIWKYASLSRLFDALGGIKVNRGSADRESMKTCVEALEQGDPVVVFPEGTRRSGPVIEEIFEGAAYMACRAGVPIVPVGIGGSAAAMAHGKKLPRPARIRVIIGEPLYPQVSEGKATSRRAVRELNERLHVELQRLFDLADGRAPNAR